MKYYLVTESGNYADEFDLEAFRLIKANSEDDLKDQVLEGLADQIKDSEDDYSDEDKYLAWPMEFYFGTNEAVTYKNKEEILADLGISEITELQYNIINEVIGSRFGVGAIL